MDAGNFTFAPSVKRIGSYDTQNRTRVGTSPGGKFVTHPFCVGAFSFSNPISATIFAYLFKTVGGQGAIAGVTEIERQMEKADILKAFLKAVAENLRDGAIEYAIPPTKILNAVNSVVDQLGSWYIMGKISTDHKDVSKYNSYNPTSNPGSYAEHALGYWKKYKEGPAYMLQRDTVKPR